MKKKNPINKKLESVMEIDLEIFGRRVFSNEAGTRIQKSCKPAKPGSRSYLGDDAQPITTVLFI